MMVRKETFEVGMEKIVLDNAVMGQLKDFNVQLAKRFCPVVTGKLRKSIKGKVEDKSIIVGTNVDYAEYVEFGTRGMIQAHGPHDPKNPVKHWEAKRKRGDTTSLQQMPFLRPAAFHTLKEMKRILPKKVKLNLRVVSK